MKFSALLTGARFLVMLLAGLNYNSNLGLAFAFLIASIALVGMHHTHRNLLGLRVDAARAIYEAMDARIIFLTGSRDPTTLTRIQLGKPFAGATVVVTHHAPHRSSIARRFEDDWLSGCFASELPDEFFEVPSLWVHGYTHDSADYTVGNCRVICNPRGYPLRMTRGFENEAFDEWLVVEV